MPSLLITAYWLLGPTAKNVPFPYEIELHACDIGSTVSVQLTASVEYTIALLSSEIATHTSASPPHVISLHPRFTRLDCVVFVSIADQSIPLVLLKI